jgi:hypothetical protein
MAENKERFDIINGKQIALLVAPSLVFVLACVAVAARWYTRSVRRVNTITEDALCLAALVCSIGTIAHALLTHIGYELCCRDAGVHSGVPMRRRIIKRTDQE